MGSPDYSDGCMIALYPPQQLADQLSVPDGLPASEMHVTVAYLGSVAEVDRDAMHAAAQALAARPPIAATVSGHARFTGGESDVIVALVDSPDLEDLRRDCLDQLAERGVEVPREHGYCPHISLSYIDPDAGLPLDRLAPELVMFGGVAAVYGTERTNYAFLPAETAPGREPAAETATIQLSNPHGIWRPVYARRQALHATADQLILNAWRADLAGLRLGPAIAAWRTALGETITDEQQRRREAAAAAVLAALNARSWQRTRAAMALAVQQAHRAGWAAGHAIVTRDADDASDYDDQPDTGGSLTLGSPDMDPATARYTADQALSAALAAASRRAGRALADADDGEDTDPEQAAGDTLDDGDDAQLAGDTAVSAAYGLGLLAAYTAAGLQSVDLITAGDGVCATCEQAAAGGPYSPFAAPRLPLHPRCRCILS